VDLHENGMVLIYVARYEIFRLDRYGNNKVIAALHGVYRGLFFGENVYSVFNFSALGFGFGKNGALAVAADYPILWMNRNGAIWSACVSRFSEYDSIALVELDLLNSKPCSHFPRRFPMCIKTHKFLP
jgi:hypothetical protein